MVGTSFRDTNKRSPLVVNTNGFMHILKPGTLLSIRQANGLQSAIDDEHLPDFGDRELFCFLCVYLTRALWVQQKQGNPNLVLL